MKGNAEVALPALLPFVVFDLFFAAFYISGDRISSRRMQVIFLYLISGFVIITNSVVYKVGYFLFIFVFFLSQKYAIFIKHIILYYLVLLAYLCLAIFLCFTINPINSFVANEELSVWEVLNQLNFLLTIILLIIIVFEDDIKRLTAENKKLSNQIEKSRVFVNLGENISGLIHNMNGDLGLMTTSISMLEEEVDHKAIDFLKRGEKNLQGKIRNILTLAKYSQAEEEMEFSINALLLSLLEVFNINKQYRIVSTTTDFRDEVFFLGNPSEISQVFENIMKNAYEALLEKSATYQSEGDKGYDPQLKVQISGFQSESLIEFIDNGPGIKACLEEKNCQEDCLSCHVFKVGRSSKKNGTGLGMVSVIRTLKKYEGRLKIKTSPEGTNISIYLARG